jgi:hypothetical protein
MCSSFSLSFPLSLLIGLSFCMLVNLPSFSHSEPYCSTFSIIREALKIMNLERLQEIEMIGPTPLPPWRKEAFSEIRIQSDREIAI